jgi:hypothetical protein
MLKVIVAVALGVAVLTPSATVFADEGNYGDRDTPRPSIVVQTEPINLGTVAGDNGLPVGPTHTDQEHADKQ